MADTNLNDNMVKLVEYTIVTIEREKETMLHGPQQKMLTDDLTGDAFSNARIAEWINGRHEELSRKGIKPSTLRVYYNVLDRWPKEDLKRAEKAVNHDEQQLEILREIADRLGSNDTALTSKSTKGK